ncbi:unnamed protein product [Sphagnum balticum]
MLRLWADAICINQSDVEDRNQQVQIMGLVYSLAQHTVIFPGVFDTETASVMQHIASRKVANSQDRTGLSDEMKRIVKSNILTHPWFIREWILQELVLSRYLWLQCGTHRVRWERFTDSVLCYLKSGEPLVSAARDMNSIKTLHQRDKA